MRIYAAASFISFLYCWGAYVLASFALCSNRSNVNGYLVSGKYNIRVHMYMYVCIIHVVQTKVGMCVKYVCMYVCVCVEY